MEIGRWTCGFPQYDRHAGSVRVVHVIVQMLKVVVIRSSAAQSRRFAVQTVERTPRFFPDPYIHRPRTESGVEIVKQLRRAG